MHTSFRMNLKSTRVNWPNKSHSQTIIARNCMNLIHSKGIRDVSKWSKKMREPLENIYGAANFQQIWSDWIDGYNSLAKRNNGNICRDEIKKIKAKTLIVHGAKDPMIAMEHVPFLRNHIPHNEYGLNTTNNVYDCFDVFSNNDF